MKSVFISSTFKDMNFERDILNTRVSPKLNYLLSKYNQSMRVVDLRWGVDTTDMTEEDACARVLSACFDSIDNCKPYMIVLIGDRYGYIPENYDISVTHMEILRGVFKSTDGEHVYIYFRDGDYSGAPEEIKSQYIEQNEASKARLDELKEELQKAFPNSCKHYSAKWSDDDGCMVSEEFESMIIRDLEEDLIRENQGVRYRSELHKYICENEELLREHVKFAYSNEEKISSDIESILASAVPLGIIGEGGAGKSIYTSLLCSALKNKGYRTNILFCGDNAFSASARSAAEMVLYMLSEESDDYAFEESAELTYDEIIGRITQMRCRSEKKQYLFLDAVDKCDRGMIDFISWCGNFLAKQIKIVFSSRLTKQIDARSGTFDLVNIIYGREDYQQMIRSILNQHTKSISDVHIENILDKVITPLQLNLLLRRLLNLKASDYDAIQNLGGGIDAINTYLKQVIDESPAETDELISAYMKDLFDESGNVQFAACVLNFLALCEYGLKEDDLRELFKSLNNIKWVSLDYIEFLEQFSFFIRIRENGRIDISHDVIRDTLRELFGDSRITMCSLIAKYLLEKENLDAADVRTFFAIVFEGAQHKIFLDFLIKYNVVVTSKENGKSPLSSEIKSEFRRLYFKDFGLFIMSAVNTCRSVEEIMYLQTFISSSLLEIYDFIDEEDALKIVYAVMYLPTRIGIITGEFFDMQMHSCERFLKRHSVSAAKIEEFIEFCKRASALPERSAKVEESSSPQDMVRDMNSEDDPSVKAVKLFELSKIARRMAADEASARDAEYLSFELLKVLGEDRLGMDEMIDGDVYTTLGVVYKTLKEWEKGIEYANMSLAVFKNEYEKDPTPELFRRYREHIYDLANIIEAWALDEKNDPALWERSKKAFEDCYAVELLAMSKEASGRDVLQASSCILSLGTALINLGNIEEGIEKYNEGIAIVENYAKNKDNPDLYSELSIYLLDCIYMLLDCEKHEAAHRLSLNIGKYLSLVVESESSEFIEKIHIIVRSFSNGINRIADRYNAIGKREWQLVAFRILCNIYEAILPIAPYEVRANLIVIRCNIGAIYFSFLDDLPKAYEEYSYLMDLVIKHNLIAPDEGGECSDEAVFSLVDVYTRSLLCLESLGRRDELKSLIDESIYWIDYFVSYLNDEEWDTPRFLYEFFLILMRHSSTLGIPFLVMAYSAVMNEEYDQKAHFETVRAIIETMAKLEEEDERDNED